MSVKKKKNPADLLVSSVLNELKASDQSSPADKARVASEPTEVISTDNASPAPLISPHLEASADSSSNNSQLPQSPLGDQQPSSDRTQVVGGSMVPDSSASDSRSGSSTPEVKTSFGVARPSSRSGGWGASSDAQVLQAESLRMAQSRMTELEKEIDKLREENETLTSACEFARNQAQELTDKLDSMERARSEQVQHYLSEINIYKENMKEGERSRSHLKKKVEELQTRLQADLRKIRVRERELENRLEMAKLERSALLRSKDDLILDLKSKVDQKDADIQSLQAKNQELQGRVESHQSQVARTVRALRLALTNLEAAEKTEVTLTPFKKAE